MNRLKHILLAGTLVPALTLSLIPAGAQAPDAGDRPGGKRHHEGGAEHGKREGGGQKGAARQRDGEGGGNAERRANKSEEGNGAGKAKRAGGDNEGGGKGKRAGADDEGPGKAKRAGGDNDGPGKAKRAGADEDSPRGRRKKEAEGDNAGSKAAERKEERRERKENARGDRDNDRRTGERKRDDDNDRRAGDRKRDDDNDRRAGGRKRDDDNDRRAGGRKRDDDNDRRAGDRKRDDDNDRRTGDRKRDDANDRRAGDRDNARDNDRRNAQERREDRREDRREERREDRRLGDNDRRDGPGFGGGFMPAGNARRLDDLRRDRREVREGDRVFIREPGRTIVRENGRAFIVHDETDRYRALGYNVRRERRGEQFIDTVTRPNGDVIITYTDNSGRLLRRARRGPGGREVILIDNGFGGRVRPVAEDVVVLPPPQVRIPRDRYVVDYGAANASLLYDTLSAPPVAPPPQRYTLDQIRYSPDVRNYVRQVDINTINFESGSWEVPRDAESKLEALAGAINKAIDKNQNAVFLIEGYTDATGNPDDNLSLSDRRAQSVAEILTKDFKIPPENLTTQGYGEQNLKEKTDGPSAVNRRVVVRNITQLLASGEDGGEH